MSLKKEMMIIIVMNQMKLGNNFLITKVYIRTTKFIYEKILIISQTRRIQIKYFLILVVFNFREEVYVKLK